MTPRLTAKIYKHKRSCYYQAWFMVWDARAQKWKPKTASTRCTDEAKALSVARQYEKLALQASGTTGDAKVSRDSVMEVLNSILRISGLSEMKETRRWDEYTKEWLALKKPNVAARTFINLNSFIKQFSDWLEKHHKRNIPLNLVTGEMMQKWYLEMIEEGRKPASVNKILTGVSPVFDRAVSEGFCQRNPTDLIMRQHGGSNIRAPFTVDDITKIFTYLREQGKEDWLTLSLLGLCTGQRLQDCAQVTVESFVMQGAHRVWQLKQGKTGMSVQVPIVEPLASHLEKVIQSKTKGFLAPSLAGVPSGSPTGLSMQFGEILNAAGVDREVQAKIEGSKGQKWTNKTFHSFRHTTNSLLANAGVSDDVRRKLLGHASTQMNARYTHMQVATTAEALQKAIATAGQ